MAPPSVVSHPAASLTYQPRTDRAMSPTTLTWSTPASAPTLAPWPILKRIWSALCVRQLILDFPHETDNTKNEHERPALPPPICAYSEDRYSRPVRPVPWEKTVQPCDIRQCDHSESNCHVNTRPWVPPLLDATDPCGILRLSRDIRLLISLVPIFTYHHVQCC